MTYVAVSGGGDALAEAERLMDALRGLHSETPIEVETIQHQLPFLHGRVLSEGGLYHPKLAALALKQSLGDPLEAALFVRAHRATQPRLGATLTLDTGDMRVIRRISAAFKDIPGGQRLGPTPDYLQRIFRLELLDEDPDAFKALVGTWLKRQDKDVPTHFPKVVEALRADGLLPQGSIDDREPVDISQTPLDFPVPRSAALATLARGETGGLLALAYSNMRGYGDVHPTVAELRVGHLPVLAPHPLTDQEIEVGEVLVTECEIIAMFEQDGDMPRFRLGYGACFGHNEVKAIAMAILDRSIHTQGDAPTNDAEFVLAHVDGVEAMGFCAHYKMPHYVTFQSDLDRLRDAQAVRRNKP